MARLPALQHPSLRDTAAALPHVRGLSPARSTTAAPPHPGPIGGRCAQPHLIAGRERGGQDPRRFPCSLWLARRRRSPTMPLRHRCEYAAVLPRSLPGSSCPPPREFPTEPPAGARRLQPRSTRFRAGAASRGCHTPVPRVLLSVPLAGPEPSGSTGPSRRCQGCSHPPRHHPDQAAPSSAVLLRQDQRRRSLTSTRTTAPHGAHMRCGTPTPPLWSTPGCRCRR